MKLFGCTVVKNEEGMIPYVMPYVERLGYDKFVVYDDHSTDKTIEKLLKYPFIEIREFPQQDNLQDFDIKKAEIQANFFSECWQYIDTHDGEGVWMTFTDFDEVIFCSERDTLKRNLLNYIANYNYVYLNKPMVDLVAMDNRTINEGETTLAHEMGYIRGTWANAFLNSKTVLLYVNAFDKIVCFQGNHHMEAEANIERVLSLNDFNTLHVFHLKYVSPCALKVKIKTTLNSSQRIPDFNFSLKSMRGCTFPMENYFALNGLLSKMPNSFELK